MNQIPRRAVLAGFCAAPMSLFAHHGWSSFDTGRPLYLEGKARRVRWQNPHAEIELQVAANLSRPADLAQRPLPAQSAPVDGRALLEQAVPPLRKDALWTVELAPLTRMHAWKIPEITLGASVTVVGFGLRDGKGDPVVRAEYLFLDGKTYGLRSGPA